MKPLISIIIPTFNRANVLEDTLKSVIDQSYTRWECLVIDDGSTDHTRDLVASFKDDRITYSYQSHAERSVARNLGLSKASGDYIQFLDSDDLLHRKKLELSVAEITGNGNELVVTNFKMFSKSLDNLQPAYCNISAEFLTYEHILFDWDFSFTIPIHCGFFNREALLDFKFPEKISSKEDWFLWLHVTQKEGIRIRFVDKVLAYYRIPEIASVQKNNEIKILKVLGEYVKLEDLSSYYLHILDKKNKRILQLQNSLANIKNTRTFRLSRVLKSFIPSK